ncbi:MAG: aminotransferase class I/II-fold pyridoxal phosphate-dependent enzyme [Pseudomonadota bacterium]
MFHPFQVEQFLSEHEELAHYNFSESGVHPLTLAELLDMAGADVADVNALLLDYPEVRGTATLRERIAALYPNADAAQVLVTVGASEANRLAAETLLEAGDEVIAIQPTYQQLPGNALNLGYSVKTVPLVENEGWALDQEVLKKAVTNRTRIISVVNPNNPTGKILSDTEMDAVVAAAERSGAWIVADEVYAGTERETNTPTPSFWNRTERVLAINSMSKAYGLPGLRLGWVVAPAAQIDPLWRRHEYATITATMLSNHLAELALTPGTREQVVDRARRLIRRGFDLLYSALASRSDVFSVVPPQASAMSFVNFDLPVDSVTFAKRLLNDHQMLVIPGACFGSDTHFRFSSALPEDYLAAGLERLLALAEKVRNGR